MITFLDLGPGPALPRVRAPGTGPERAFSRRRMPLLPGIPEDGGFSDLRQGVGTEGGTPGGAYFMGISVPYEQGGYG